jgi:hypothetical protein
MKRISFAVFLGVFLFLGCVVGPGYRGEGMVMVPALPSIVVFQTEPYYYQDGYHYHYQSDRWYYSNSRSGPWSELPRDRYPKEVRYENRGGDRGNSGKSGHGDSSHGSHGYDNHGYDNHGYDSHGYDSHGGYDKHD